MQIEADMLHTYSRRVLNTYAVARMISVAGITIMAWAGITHVITHRLLSSSFLWFIFRILEGNPQKELLRSLWVIRYFGPMRTLVLDASR